MLFFLVAAVLENLTCFQSSPFSIPNMPKIYEKYDSDKEKRMEILVINSDQNLRQVVLEKKMHFEHL